MPKYYLHVVSKDARFADDRGVDLNDLAAAHRYAVTVIYQCMRFDSEEKNWRDWQINIADCTGKVLLTVVFPTYFGPRRGSFGLRSINASRNLLAAVAFCGTFSLTCITPAIGGDRQCVQIVFSSTCSNNTPDPGKFDEVVRLAPTDEGQARDSKRELDWYRRCKPIVRQDHLGVSRYEYSAPGCEFGKSED